MRDSSFGHLIGIFVHPTKTFRTITEQPDWRPPALALLVVGVVFIALLIPRVDWNVWIRAQHEDSGKLSAEQLAARVEMMEEFGFIWLWCAVPMVLIVVFPLTAWIFYGALNAVGSEMSLRQGFTVTLYGLLPAWGLSGLLLFPRMIGMDEINPGGMDEWSNPAFLAGDNANPALVQVLASLDVFSFWSLALLTIGFSVAGRISRGRAATCVVGLWFLYVVIAVGLQATGIAM